MLKYSRHAPILFLVFNRPDTTQEVFQAIRQARPKKLYVAADGPRSHRKTDAEKCQQVRAIFQDIDWDCDLHTLFREENLGCRRAVSSAIDWFFSQEEEGIILEDDCLPNQSFFGFCEALLEHYRTDSRVMHIGGSNFQSGIQRGNTSYYFSRLFHVWGWASWRRAWNLYDVDVKKFSEFKEEGQVAHIFFEEPIQQDVLNNVSRVYHGGDTWDQQWWFTGLIHHGLSIIPNVNLVSNIGFREDATHTVSHEANQADLATYEMEGLSHPPFMIPHREADTYTTTKVFHSPSLYKRAIRKIKQLTFAMRNR